mmetsp:Transcript_12995/g.25822  ORF Transcript_12995/g.25822 Transcript_12995/m.25822 type:complete len:372 (+) Transcript_12995:91-1206(+)
MKNATMTAREVQMPLVEGLVGVKDFCRGYLAKQVDWSCSLLPYFQRTRGSKFMCTYMRTASLLGSEEFYIVNIPILMWCLAPGSITRVLVCLFGITMYVGNFLKNLLCLPRPSGKYLMDSGDATDRSLDNRDFGWPSVHSLNGVAIPFFALRCMFGSVLLWEATDPGNMLIGYIIAFAYTGSVCFSRLFLGVHSPADVQGGMILGGIVLRLWMWAHEGVDAWLTTADPFSVIAWVTAGTLLLLLLHPRVRPTTYTYEESTCLLGFLGGFLIGGALSRAYDIPLETPDSFLLGAGRMLVGYAMMFFGREVIKAVTKPVLCTPPQQEKKDDDALPGVGPFAAGDVTARLLQYGVGFGTVVSFGAPAAFQALGL